MKPSPIELTPEQKKEAMERKIANFKEHLTRLENETGMKEVAVLHHTHTGIHAIKVVLPIDKEQTHEEEVQPSSE